MLMVLILILPLRDIARSSCDVVPLMKAPIEQCNMYLEVAAANHNAKGDVVMLKFVVETIWQDLFKDNFASSSSKGHRGSLDKRFWSPSQ